MIISKIFFNWAQDNNVFLVLWKKLVKNGYLNSQNLSGEKKTTRAQIFRQFLRKSEQ